MSDLLAIAPEVFALIPGLRVVVVVADELTAARPQEADARWSAAWSRVHASFGFANPQSHPHVQAWRVSMKGAGASHKEYPTSVEALVRRALKSPQPFRINPYVDFYNSVSLEHVVPAGGYDLDSLPGPLELRLTRVGDSFQALDAATPEPVPAGELAYACGSQVVTRHLVWRQSRLGLVTAETRSALFLSEVLPSHPDVAGPVQDALASGLRELFGARVEAVVLSADAPVLER
ncbi:MAG TPA: phenylalanine--tRNA ligase beta subunit-related protein [Thermoanaerobaculia bacterium]|nr:phenylalanine--tRNA ligase beta subunit-related protein [Thermoanaerobaculia bacterium]